RKAPVDARRIRGRGLREGRADDPEAEVGGMAGLCLQGECLSELPGLGGAVGQRSFAQLAEIRACGNSGGRPYSRPVVRESAKQLGHRQDGDDQLPGVSRSPGGSAGPCSSGPTERRMSDLNQITAALERLFVEEGHRIVFWNDPDKEFLILLSSLKL